jgi:hypothetical protein
MAEMPLPQDVPGVCARFRRLRERRPRCDVYFAAAQKELFADAQ